MTEFSTQEVNRFTLGSGLRASSPNLTSVCILACSPRLFASTL